MDKATVVGSAAAVETTVVESGSEPLLPALLEPSSASTQLFSAEELRDARYPTELHKLFVIAPFFVVAFLANSATLAINHDLVGREALPDLVHMVVPQYDWAFRVGDYLVIVVGSVNIFNLLLHRHRAIVLRRVMSVIFLFRDVMMSVTGMPPGFWDSGRQCQAASNATDWGLVWTRVWGQVGYAGLQDGSESQGGYLCGDMMFSGHTACLAIGCFTFTTYTHASLWPLRWMVWLMMLVGVPAMVVSRAHYTIDLIVSYWISTGFFSIYHAFCEVPGSSRDRSSFRRMWWFWALYWLEDGCPAGALPNSLSWPLPWPRAVHDRLREWNQRHPDGKPAESVYTANTLQFNSHSPLSDDLTQVTI